MQPSIPITGLSARNGGQKGELGTPPSPHSHFLHWCPFGEISTFDRRPFIGGKFGTGPISKGKGERDPFRLRQCHFDDENSNSFCNKTQTKWHFFPSCILFSTDIPAHAVKLSKRSSKTFSPTPPRITVCKIHQTLRVAQLFVFRPQKVSPWWSHL